VLRLLAELLGFLVGLSGRGTVNVVRAWSFSGVKPFSDAGLPRAFTAGLSGLGAGSGKVAVLILRRFLALRAFRVRGAVSLSRVFFGRWSFGLRGDWDLGLAVRPCPSAFVTEVLTLVFAGFPGCVCRGAFG